MFHNKTIFIKSFNNVYKKLSGYTLTNRNTSKDVILFSGTQAKENNDNYAIMHYNIYKNNTLCIWKTDILFNYWYTDFISSTKEDHVASIDYRIENDTIEIDYLCVNDKKIIKPIIIYIQNIAKANNKLKIIMNTQICKT